MLSQALPRSSCRPGTSPELGTHFPARVRVEHARVESRTWLLQKRSPRLQTIITASQARDLTLSESSEWIKALPARLHWSPKSYVSRRRLECRPMQATAIELAEVVGDVSARSRRDTSCPQEPGSVSAGPPTRLSQHHPPGYAVQPSKQHRVSSSGKPFIIFIPRAVWASHFVRL